MRWPSTILATRYRGQGKQDEAIAHLDEALRIKPGYAQAYFNRGNAYGVQGKVDQAIADYREAIRYKPDYEQAYCNLAKGLALRREAGGGENQFPGGVALQTGLRRSPYQARQSCWCSKARPRGPPALARGGEDSA